MELVMLRTRINGREKTVYTLEKDAFIDHLAARMKTSRESIELELEDKKEADEKERERN